ncbi:hypothetical protein D3C76_638040 [compost metagenome]
MKVSETIFISIGGFNEWNEFRAFALKLAGLETSPPPVRHMELTANEGNPFVPSDVHEVTVALHDVKQNVWEGELYISYVGETRPAAQRVLSADEEATEASFVLASPSSTCSVIQLDARLGPQHIAPCSRCRLFPSAVLRTRKQNTWYMKPTTG